MKLRGLASQEGFSLVEVTAVLVVLGLLAAVAVTRQRNDPTRAITARDTLANHLRSAQMRSMQSGGIQTGPAGTVGQVYGLTCDGTTYWVFSGTAPNGAGAVARVQDDPNNLDANGKVLLSSKGVTATAFTVFFNGFGTPCTAYTNESTYTAQAGTLTVTITDPYQNTPSIQTLTLAPGTGYIP